MKLIVDVQGFKTELNQFIPKEIAILRVGGKGVQSFLVRQPYPFYDLTKKEMRQVNWIEKNRNIYWKEGFIPFSNYKHLISPLLENKTIYVKGDEKVKWVTELFLNYNVVNLENFKCPNLDSLYDHYKNCSDVYTCFYHKNICALKNVICLNKWCIENDIVC